ncbi:universal stress protein [Methylobacterium aerolatum]|uniref:Nucleotide-binding universal stress UspA family protein n=1 Tax=Methylobacterium aerolatum TaxID=418708 RepID=A0ABU0I3F2_9HYPH|nr:universal stress protein [Methylobacterium aerolatum]MDQ0449134.1 nucleotide-binding universal stress UspA family protein [Methylobacterium aerolatum]GJD35322.1 hypothetical protein FMGBMHLM_2232 [Methylobacterium aerolatum]
MDFANILVAVDLGDAAPGRVRLAAGLARRFSASLTGAAAHTVAAPILVSDLDDAARQEARNTALVREILDEAHALFTHGAGDGIRTDWQAALTDPITHLVEQARAADIVVVGRHGPDDGDPGPLRVRPGPVLMEAGRPVLIVPPRVASLRAERIVVAWKDAPEARRAITAVLPFLHGADRVCVATVGAEPEGGVEAVAGHLARHGAHVTASRLPAGGCDGDEILAYAARQDADLIVMGAYGHSRLREWIVGGVTREVLDRASVCCLMCH